MQAPRRRSNGTRSSSRAAACVVNVAAASSISASASNRGTALDGRGRQQQRHSAGWPTIFTIPASGEFGVQHVAMPISSVPINTAACNATVAASESARATALQAASVRCAAIAPPGADQRNNGRARNTRNSTPPSAIDCARIVSPCTTIDR